MLDHVTTEGSRHSLLWRTLLAWILGSALQLQQASLWAKGYYGAVGLLASVTLVLAVRGHARARGARRRNLAWVVFLALLLLAFASVGWRAARFADHALAAELEGRDLQVIGVVVGLPQRNESGVHFRLDVESAQWNGQRVQVPNLLALGWYSGIGSAFEAGTQLADLQRQPSEVHAGERWSMTVRLKAPHGNSNPHGFDYELWLWEQGVQASGYVRAGRQDAPPQLWVQTGHQPVQQARQAVRDAVYERIPDRQQAGLIAALVVGDQNAIDKAQWDVFRATGVAHLMSISGLHITMFSWLAALLIGALWRRSSSLCLTLPAPSAAIIGGVLLASAYALFSGWGVPAQRTIWMLLTVGLLKLSGRRWPWPMVWLLAMAVVVAIDPWAVLQAGFWLSFVAVGVLFAADAGQDARVPPNWSRRWRAAAREQWVITLALTPLSLLLFNQVSVVGLLANALAIPWVTLLMTPLAMLGMVWSPLWDVAAWAAVALDVVLRALAALPLATFSVAAAPLGVAVVGVLGGLVLAMPWTWSLRLLGVPLLLPVLLWQTAQPRTGEFELLAADIGQGNAVLLRTAKHALLYDAGPRFSRESDAGHRSLVPLLRAMGQSVDTLVLSHRDVDHIGGAAALLAMQPHMTLLSSIEAGHNLQALRAAQRCFAGQMWDWDGVHFEILRPLRADYESALKPNAMSCVLRVSNGRRTVLLTGDIEQAQEAQLVARYGGALQADVLLVPHHGSKTSSSAAFLDAVAAPIALVQAGYRNRFGHPAPTVLARYRERGIHVVSSPQCGAAIWASERPDMVRCWREEAAHYWQHRAPPFVPDALE